MMWSMTDIIPIDEHAALCLAADRSGSLLLEALVDGTTLAELVTAVEMLYRDRPDRLAADVDELLAAYEQGNR
jgi:hypothetical protein